MSSVASWGELSRCLAALPAMRLGDPRAAADHVGVRVDSGPRALWHWHPIALRRERIAIDLSFKVNVPPLNHCVARSDCARGVYAPLANRFVVKSVRHDPNSSHGIRRS